MNWERIQADWRCFKGRIKEEWGRLTEDDLDVIDGRREQLAGRIQKAYALEKREAERQIDRFCSDCK